MYRSFLNRRGCCSDRFLSSDLNSFVKKLSILQQVCRASSWLSNTDPVERGQQSNNLHKSSCKNKSVRYCNENKKYIYFCLIPEDIHIYLGCRKKSLGLDLFLNIATFTCSDLHSTTTCVNTFVLHDDAIVVARRANKICIIR